MISPSGEINSLKPVRVFVDSTSWFVRPRNTDWRYTRYSIPALPQFEAGIEVYAQTSWRTVLQESARYLLCNVAARLGNESFDSYRGSLDLGELKRSHCEVVFSHRRFPTNAKPFPVVWQNSILDPQMTSYYYPKMDLQRELDLKGPLFSASTVVHVSTEAEVDRLSKTFPGLPNRFISTPMFVPVAQAAKPELLEKHGDQLVRILFAGDQAIRKGLDILVEAFRCLPNSIRSRSRLIIISRRTDGPVSIPDDPSIEFHPGLSHEQVMAAMRTAHILAVPSRFESYGLVYLEAMSQGVVPVAPDWEVQRELLDGGHAGSLAQPGNVQDLRLQLERLIEDGPYRLSLAQSAHQRFCDHYSPGQVARKFHRMLDIARSRA